MRIIKFVGENIKRIKTVQITPEGRVIEITGPNGQGKSSVLDAIFYALRGTEGIPTKVVRQGEEKAFVKLEIGDSKPELIITRHFSAVGTTRLTVESPEGAVFKSPQSLLDTLVGALSFDPLEFIRLKPAEQLNALRAVVKLDVDLDKLDAQTQKVFEARTGTKRELKRLEARLMVLPAPAVDTPDSMIDTGALVQALEEAGQFNARREAELKHIEMLTDRIKRNQAERQEKVNLVEREKESAERQIESIRANLIAAIAKLVDADATLKELVKKDHAELEISVVFDAVDTAKLAEEIKAAG